MLVFRSLRRPLIVSACLFALAAAPGSWAQSTSGEDPFVVGATDGRRIGLRQGRILGRAQALYESFHDGFRQGLEEAGQAGVSGGLAQRIRLDGRQKGLALGLQGGREAGAETALAGWIATGAQPSLPEPNRAPAPPEQAPEICRPARALQLPLAREVTVELDPDGLEERNSPVVVDSFDLPYPSVDDLRNRARAAGATSEAVGNWVRDYKDAFQSAWYAAFENERSGTPLDDEDEFEQLGLEHGRREGERRLACESGQEQWQGGFDEGWAEAWRQGFEETWKETNERHSKRAVVILQEPRLIDASGDGLLEPGEGLRLEARLVNAGAVEARRSAGSWGVVRGLESEGHLEGGLAPGESRDLKLELGNVDPDAPPGTSVVLRVRGLGSDALTLSERLGRPARIQAAEAKLVVEEGRLVARIEATISSLSPASARAELELAGRGGTVAVGRLEGGESKTVSLLMPASLPSSVGSPVTGVFVLRTSEGLPWHAGRWSAAFGLPEAVASAAADDAPTALGALLVDHLVAEWTAFLTTGEKQTLPAGIEAYADARVALPQEARDRLDELVTAPLLERLDERTSPKRMRKRARERLAG